MSETFQYDHLGSLVALRNTNGTVAESYSYDPWGRRRNPSDWSYSNVPVPVITNRGFTGHEHLEKFNLIDMNGRVYDPVTAGFLSPDPFVTNPYFSQSYNSYSYCVNNPLKFTDPSGYVPEGFSDPCRVPRNRRINPNDTPLIWDIIQFLLDLSRLGGDGPNEDYVNYQRPDTYSSGDDGYYYPDSDPLMYSGGGSGAVFTSGQYQSSPTGISRPVPADLSRDAGYLLGWFKQGAYWAEAIFRIRNNMPADAYSIAGNIDIVGILGADMSFPGRLWVTRGGDRGKSTNIFDFGIAAGFDLGASAVITSYYFVGDINQLKIGDFEGPRWNLSLGFSFLVELGGSLMVAPVPGKGYLIGKMSHLGVSPPGVSGNINRGQTIFY